MLKRGGNFGEVGAAEKKCAGGRGVVQNPC